MYNFGDNLVRILQINLKNYKNISSGQVKTSSISNIENNKGDIRGIYGQNGSGKTSIISAVGLIKNIFLGESLPEDIHEYIMYGKDNMEVEVIFYIKNNLKRYKVKYSITIFISNERSLIKTESLHYWDGINDKWNKMKALIVNKYNKNDITPKYRNEEILKLYNDNSDFIVNKKIAFEKRKSLIFSDGLLNMLNNNSEKIGKEYEILNILQNYANFNLFVIDNKQLALSDANILLPMNFKNYNHNKHISTGVMPIGLENSTYLPREAIDEIETSLVSSNKVINEIIPGLRIKLKELSMQISKLGDEEVLVELLSCRNDVEIPIRYESDGIKKIVAILHLLIAMFNNNSTTVLIDELDSGIFEYLLGEILEILEERGKGQLIFTSHNLRPLEVLNKNSLIFTTTNPDNRYIKLRNVKSNNNLRDMYYRDLILGGQDETIYAKTNSAKITRAFRKAGG